MSPTLIASICGIITAIGFGTGDWLSGKASKKDDKYETNFAVQFYATIVALPTLLVAGFHNPNLNQLGVMFVISILITAAYICFMKALETGTVGIVAPLTNIYPLFTILLSITILGTAFSGHRILAMIIIVLGAVMLAYEKNHKKIPLKTLHRESMLALWAAVFYSLDFFFIGTLINHVSWPILMVSTSVYLTIIGAVLVWTTTKKSRIAAFKAAFLNKTGCYAGIFFALGAISFYYGSNKAGSIIVPTVISGSAPLVASILGAVFDKEKIGLLKRAGAVIVISGIIILNITK